jgi:anti-anti-sigma regulatory factor
MNVTKRAVHVFQVPQTTNDRQRRDFLREIAGHIENERPRFVLDCSNITNMNDETVHLLLCSLEEAMKSNGDVRLAGLSASAEAVVDRSGVSRLFETFKTVDSAIQSFQRASSLTPRRFARTPQTALAFQAA